MATAGMMKRYCSPWLSLIRSAVFTAVISIELTSTKIALSKRKICFHILRKEKTGYKYTQYAIKNIDIDSIFCFSLYLRVGHIADGWWKKLSH